MRTSNLQTGARSCWPDVVEWRGYLESTSRSHRLRYMWRDDQGRLHRRGYPSLIIRTQKDIPLSWGCYWYHHGSFASETDQPDSYRCFQSSHRADRCYAWHTNRPVLPSARNMAFHRTQAPAVLRFGSVINRCLVREWWHRQFHWASWQWGDGVRIHIQNRWSDAQWWKLHADLETSFHRRALLRAKLNKRDKLREAEVTRWRQRSGPWAFDERSVLERWGLPRHPGESVSWAVLPSFQDLRASPHYVRVSARPHQHTFRLAG